MLILFPALWLLWFRPSHSCECLGKYYHFLLHNLISLLLYVDDKFEDTINQKLLIRTSRLVPDLQNFDAQLFFCCHLSYPEAVVLSIVLLKKIFELLLQRASFTCNFTLGFTFEKVCFISLFKKCFELKITTSFNNGFTSENFMA